MCEHVLDLLPQCPVEARRSLEPCNQLLELLAVGHGGKESHDASIRTRVLISFSDRALSPRGRVHLCWGAVLGQAPAPMLAQLETKLPAGLNWRYEPKLDGFRGLLWRRSESQTLLLSGNSRDLAPWFPELSQAAKALPPNTLVDGEIVICDESGWVDFGGLQARLSKARNMLTAAARDRPAVPMVFDILECDGVELASRPMGLRRLELVRLLDGAHPCLQVVDHTDDIRLARDWLTLPNFEGVVAKRVDRPYTSGRARDWVKVERQRTVDCVVVGIAGELATPKLVLALQHSDGRLHHLGRLGGVICHLDARRQCLQNGVAKRECLPGHVRGAQCVFVARACHVETATAVETIGR
jgi:ATP-dependent DNA ligase